MENAKRKFGTPEWLVLIGASVFILVLAISAFFEADICWLHFFQAWMYIVTIALSLQGNRWGYFVGISAAGFWDYANVFATTFFFNGLEELSHWVHTGHLARPDLFIAVPAWFSNLLVIHWVCVGHIHGSQQNPEMTSSGFWFPALSPRFFSPQTWLCSSRAISASFDDCCTRTLPNGIRRHSYPWQRRGAQAEIPISFDALSSKHGERNPPASRFVCFSAGRRNVLVHWPIGDAIECIRDPRQFIDDLVAHHGPLQNDCPPTAKLLHGPGCRRHDENHNRQKLFPACDGDRTAKEMIDMIREQFFLPAGAIVDNYSIGCLFARRRQSNSYRRDNCCRLAVAKAAQIGLDISRHSGIPSGTLYPILMRLDELGWLETKWEDAVPPGRPPRHLYRLSGNGREWAREELRAARQREFFKPAASEA